MHWKNETISSTSDAEDFLRRQFASLGATNLKIECNYHKGLSFWAGTDASGEASCLANFEINNKRGITVQNAFVAKKVRGNGLGLMAAKCAIGMAYEHAEKSVVFFQVRQDGLGFWPTLGALPQKKPHKIGTQIRLALDKHKEEIEDSSAQELEQIILLAKKDTFAAWRALSQTNIRLENGSFFKQAVFEEICFKKDLNLPLNAPETQKIMRQRLGSLPYFAVT